MVLLPETSSCIFDTSTSLKTSVSSGRSPASRVLCAYLTFPVWVWSQIILRCSFLAVVNTLDLVWCMWHWYQALCNSYLTLPYALYMTLLDLHTFKANTTVSSSVHSSPSHSLQNCLEEKWDHADVCFIASHMPFMTIHSNTHLNTVTQYVNKLLFTFLAFPRCISFW